MRLQNSSFIALAACAIVLASRTENASATVINVNQAFVNFEIANSGPTPAVNGDFQYGSAPSTTSVAAGATSIPLFAQYLATEHTDNFLNVKVQGYNQANAFLTPFTVVNTDTTNAQTLSCCPITFQPSEIGLHPDNGGLREYSVVLWTAPLNGTFSDSATYANRGGNGSTLVYLQDPTGTQTSTTGAAPTLTSSGIILAGETIAFFVGSNNGFGANSTGLYATINFTPVPEPSSFILGGLGAVGLFVVARRRRQA